MTWLKVEQTFTIDNADYYVSEETWTIVSINYPNITFFNNKHWLVDAAYILPFSTETVIGTVEKETDTMAIVALKFTRFACEAGLLLEGKQASYLQNLDPIIYL